jgi:predicted O-methyltransferase YrrM
MTISELMGGMHLNPPPIVKDIEEATASIGFTMGSDHLTGSLLRTLAASKPGGAFLELGTGTGLATAWILDGMDALSRLITVDREERHTSLARRFLEHDPRVTFHLMDGKDFISSMRGQGNTFDFIFADMQPGKFHFLEETLQLLSIGGIYIVDDLLPLPAWSEEHTPEVVKLITIFENLEAQGAFRITKLNWSVGILIAVKTQ